MLALAERRVASRGPFQMPTGRPGVDQSHFASRNLLFSGVPFNSGFVNLLSGKAGTKNGSPTESIVSPLGRSSVVPGGGSFHGYTYTGQDATNFTSNTIAVIGSFNSIATTQYFFANNTNSNGVGINITSAGLLQWTMFGVVAVSSTITLVVNVPYFIIASKNGSTGISWLVMRLDTGVIVTASTASGTPNAGNGTYIVGNGVTTTTPMIGNLAAVMFSSAYHAPALLRQWAANPWALWYPGGRY